MMPPKTVSVENADGSDEYTAETDSADFDDAAEDGSVETYYASKDDTAAAVSPEHDTDSIESEPDAYVRTLKSSEYELLKSGNDAINMRIDAKEDEYRSKGLSDEEIADRLPADKWEYQKEFLDDAFPGQNISPHVFNGFMANGANDRISEIEKSQSLRNAISDGKDFNNPIADTKESKLENYADDLESNYDVGKADFSDFDPDVANDMCQSVKQAKADFPDLKLGYIGSIDNQVNGIKSCLKDYYRSIGESVPGWKKEQIENFAEYNASNYIKNSPLNKTKDTFAWNLSIPKNAGQPTGGLSQYSGVAVNNIYASDYARFAMAKKHEVAIKHKPIGCDTPKSTADHEMGHEIDNLLDASNDPKIAGLYQKMINDGDAETKLSGYSATNVKEFIAESYSEYRNNPNPREYSTIVVDRLKELYKNRKEF
jgi:hypothetical protein